MTLLRVLALIILACSGPVILAQDHCAKQFYCDSLIRVYYGYSPQQITAIYEYSLESHYTDSAGTLHIYRDLNGKPDLEWRVDVYGNVRFGSRDNIRFKLCATVGDVYPKDTTQSGISYMQYEGIAAYPILEKVLPCLSFLEFRILNPDSNGVKDTVMTYRYFLHDSLGVVSTVSVDHGSSFRIQGVQCVHGFYGDPAVSVPEVITEQDLLTVFEHHISIPYDSWGDGILRLYSYQGLLQQENRITGPSGLTMHVFDGLTSGLLLWSYHGDDGRIHRGKTHLH